MRWLATPCAPATRSRSSHRSQADEGGMTVQLPSSETTARRRALPVYAPAAHPHVQAPPRSVRVSVTDRCDFACTYCRPSRNDGYVDGKLLLPAWKTMFEGLLAAGIRRVRLTGGEPLIHPEIVPIVEHLASLGIEDLALTTNA